MVPLVQELPAEGSREVIERELARLAQNSSARDTAEAQAQPMVTADDIVRLLGDTTPVAAILALRPRLADIEEAAAWQRGEGDLLSRSGHPLEGKPAAIFDLLQMEQEDSDR